MWRISCLIARLFEKIGQQLSGLRIVEIGMDKLAQNLATRRNSPLSKSSVVRARTASAPPMPSSVQFCIRVRFIAELHSDLDRWSCALGNQLPGSNPFAMYHVQSRADDDGNAGQGQRVGEILEHQISQQGRDW
ncbi:hypothetical protein SAMN04488239_11152 [Ruegeria marina]|uniref:Uncharacterized protein n=1 Tax=Ruegeria marina TaxID=639004 RepID=A0A1G6Y6E8_9RHOB|nr:hypothetical protein SAMN04488239_11152 [Ruegeria marina]